MNNIILFGNYFVCLIIIQFFNIVKINYLHKICKNILLTNFYFFLKEKMGIDIFFVNKLVNYMLYLSFTNVVP